MNRTEEEIMQLYNENEKLIYSTIHRRFNSPGFLSLHGLTMDDLIQYGRLGLYKACQEYNPNKNTKLSSFIISNIIWTINLEGRHDSLANKTKGSYDVIDKVSFDASHSEDDADSNIYNLLESREEGLDRVFIESFLQSVEQNISETLANIILFRIQGYSYQEIGDAMSMSHQGIRNMIVRNRSKLAKLLESFDIHYEVV